LGASSSAGVVLSWSTPSLSPSSQFTWSFSTITYFPGIGFSLDPEISSLSSGVWILRALCTLVFLIADFSLMMMAGFVFSTSGSSWLFLKTFLSLASIFFFCFFLASSTLFSLSFSSLTELPPSPPCEVEADGCFLFLMRGISYSSSSSS
jgi:hypothetical protein